MIGTSVQLKRLVRSFDATLYSGSSSNEVIKKLVQLALMQASSVLEKSVHS